MNLSLIAVSRKGRKAYKNDTGTLYLECTKCKAIKDSYSFINKGTGFQGKRNDCKECRNKSNKIHTRKWRQKRAYAKHS
jgi:hypothetical protein